MMTTQNFQNLKRIGILTGGGDAPGLNSILESACKTLLKNQIELIGIEDGFEGIFNNKIKPITLFELEGIHSQAGTLLGTSNKSGTTGRESEFLKKFKSLRLDGLIAAGGDGTFRGLQPFEKEIPLIGVPKTIDNDLAGTEVTFGFDTACSVVSESIDALRATAHAHRRIIVVETMGRTAGWIALGGGLASYADVILIPERPFCREELKKFILSKKANGTRGLVLAVSEGAHAIQEKTEVAFKVEGSPEPERLGGIGASLARWIEKETSWESRHVVLGHLQRSRAPTTTDRFLTLAMGVEAARMAMEGSWGNAVIYKCGRISRAPIADLMGPPRLIPADHHWIHLAQFLGIFI